MRPCAHASQSAMWTSVPHTPACRTAMSTSPGPGDGFGTVATFRPGTRCSLTMAFMETRDAGCERSEEHTSELQSQSNLVCRLLLEKKKKKKINHEIIQEKKNTDTHLSSMINVTDPAVLSETPVSVALAKIMQQPYRSTATTLHDAI